MKRLFLLLVLLCIVPYAILAQRTEQDRTGNKDSYFLMDLSYVSDAVFMGRRDSIAAPYLLPSVSYYHSSGLFADATVSYLVGSEDQRVDLFYVTGGYLLGSDRWNIGVSASAYFYNDASYNVQSETVADITGLIAYDFKLVELSLYASSYFNRKSSPDFFLGLMADRTFKAMKDRLLLMPRFSVYAGSQYFYQEYYTTSRLGNRKTGSSGKGSGQGGALDVSQTTNVQIAEASEFNILNVELSLPVQYHFDMFILSLTPVWAIPQTSATLTTEAGTFKENLNSVFYWSVGVGYWFNTKKSPSLK
ncbi:MULTISPECIES: hypothetical protein [unclassified Flagellimonas]|uniref:Outer membrane protein beta-barrel domain-containing protein n=1 Tax=Flagellimonas sp. MMG031 TaxID=3158549 RepID=A0AAU7MTQ7_9FLAO